MNYVGLPWHSGGKLIRRRKQIDELPNVIYSMCSTWHNGWRSYFIELNSYAHRTWNTLHYNRTFVPILWLCLCHTLPYSNFCITINVILRIVCIQYTHHIRRTPGTPHHDQKLKDDCAYHWRCCRCRRLYSSAHSIVSRQRICSIRAFMSGTHEHEHHSAYKERNVNPIRAQRSAARLRQMRRRTQVQLMYVTSTRENHQTRSWQFRKLLYFHSSVQ